MVGNKTKRLLDRSLSLRLCSARRLVLEYNLFKEDGIDVKKVRDLFGVLKE
jgi:hypothetical protein